MRPIRVLCDLATDTEMDKVSSTCTYVFLLVESFLFVVARFVCSLPSYITHAAYGDDAQDGCWRSRAGLEPAEQANATQASAAAGRGLAALAESRASCGLSSEVPVVFLVSIFVRPVGVTLF